MPPDGVWQCEREPATAKPALGVKLGLYAGRRTRCISEGGVADDICAIALWLPTGTWG